MSKVVVKLKSRFNKLERTANKLKAKAAVKKEELRLKAAIESKRKEISKLR